MPPSKTAYRFYVFMLEAVFIHYFAAFFIATIRASPFLFVLHGISSKIRAKRV
jgi:hypothetical protein